PFLDADAAGRDPAILEDLCDRAVGAVVFLPGADVGAELDQLARPRLLEAGAHPRELALRRNDGDERTLALAPAYAGEIEHARAALDEDGVDAVVRHQPPRLVDARAPLVERDRHDPRGHRAQRRDRRRRRGALGLRLRVGASCRAGRQPRGGRPFQKLAAMDSHRWSPADAGGVGLATDSTRTSGSRVRSTVRPSLKTIETLRRLPMSASGSPVRTTRSAIFPGSIVPRSASRREAIAPLRVAATIACELVIPSSTSPSIAMMVPMPWSCSGGFRVRDSSGAAAQ